MEHIPEEVPITFVLLAMMIILGGMILKAHQNQFKTLETIEIIFFYITIFVVVGLLLMLIISYLTKNQK